MQNNWKHEKKRKKPYRHKGEQKLKNVRVQSYGARRAQGQVVHLLGERGHHSGGVDGQTGLDGGSRRDHSTLQEEARQAGFRPDKPTERH